MSLLASLLFMFLLALMLFVGVSPAAAGSGDDGQVIN